MLHQQAVGYGGQKQQRAQINLAQKVPLAIQQQQQQQLFACQEVTSGVPCKSSFSTKKALTHHVKQVHTLPKLMCDLCSQAFQGTASLNRHKLRFHPTL